MKYLIDRHADFYIAFFDRMFASAPGKVDILRIADDLKMQNRLLMSPAMLDRFIAPPLDRIE